MLWWNTGVAVNTQEFNNYDNCLKAEKIINDTAHKYGKVVVFCVKK